MNNMQTKEKSKVGLGIAVIILVALFWAIAQISSGSGGDRRDSDCVEWGVEIENPNGTKGWAFLPATPRTKEEAEEMAHNMELQDRGGRYYKARCRRYKGE